MLEYAVSKVLAEPAYSEMAGEKPKKKNEGRGTSMAGENMLDLTDDNFEEEVLGSDVPVLVDFWATWCAPCRAIAPLIESLSDEYSGRAKVGKLDVDGNQQVAMQYKITSIPTVLVFKGGQVVGTLVGGRQKPEYESALDSALG